MGFLDSLKNIFTAGGPEADALWIYARCKRCGEVIKTRIDLRNSLSMADGGGYVVNKTLIGGSQLCFQRIEVTLHFNESRDLVEREITFGEFVTAEEYDAAQATGGD
jgi:hypothetical protein